MSYDVYLAHVVGHRDGPIPLSYALVAGTTALYASFDALRLRWHERRFDARRVWRAVPRFTQRLCDHPLLRRTLRLFGLALTVLTLTVLTTGYGGKELGPGMVFVLFWVGLVPASLLFGPVWRLLNPLRTVHELLALLLRTDPDKGIRPLPERLGHWPAAAGLLAFAWLELAAPARGSASTVLLGLWLYAAVQLTAAAVYGSRWFERGDAFEAYSSLIASLSPLGRSPADRRLVLRNPFNGLSAVRAGPGLTATVAVMLAATGFDSLANLGWWKQLTQGAPEPLARSAGLLATVLFVLGLLWVSGRASGRLSRDGSWTAALMAPSLIPIAIGYVIAHYSSVLVLEVQRFVDVFFVSGEHGSTHDGGMEAASYVVPGATLMSLVQVTAVVTGHVLGVVSAHDSAVGVLPRDRKVLPQVPLFAGMIGLTLGGLALLYST
ncbi:hypothetical protein PV371_17345 [Streptomyces sp. TX20-6-3]|uniref:hypothetical protein n=1 Tax=Streptomyces sp. TX20-6-3 TaxID=3028705 RepID=UPI0029BDD717|nr:hypothetical protein [Streptomyces sp. TX20-6-3]MDX2561412.1 hypothetical protein [Streptomyces sp. TX20-6-3]